MVEFLSGLWDEFIDIHKACTGSMDWKKVQTNFY